MIIIDTSYLLVFLFPWCPPAKDRSNQPVDRFQDRVNRLIVELNNTANVIGIPTPVLAEVLVRAGASRAAYATELSDTTRFELLPFGARAAVEAAELIAKIKADHRKQDWGTWAKLKFDVQIVAIAKSEKATVIYSDDKDIEALAKRVGIPVKRICDLPLPSDEGEQPSPQESTQVDASTQDFLDFMKILDAQEIGDTAEADLRPSIEAGATSTDEVSAFENDEKKAPEEKKTDDE